MLSSSSSRIFSCGRAFLLSQSKFTSTTRPRLLASYSSTTSSSEAAEQLLLNKLKERFPNATDLAVVDVSGGCGAMYEVYVEAPDFKGKRMVKQHQMVQDALKSEIKEMHGLRVSTAVSCDS